MKAFHLLGFCFLLLYSCSSPEDNRISEIDDLLSTLHTEKTFNGNVLIAEKGNIIYEKSFGPANFDTQQPLDESSMFNIASVSKTFTAVAILQLAEAEKLDLNDELDLYFPDFPYDSIRLINLLSHTSGLDRIQRPQIREQINRKGLDNLGVLEVYQEVKPEAHFSPGTGYFYANTNYIILALIVEQVSGLPFHQYLEENIFEKAGMESSFLKRKRVPKSLDDQVVSYYRKEKWLTFDLQDVATLDADIADKETFGNNYGESAIHTTARDLLKYHQALQNNSLLSASTTKWMYQPFEFVNGEDYEVNSKSNYPAYSALSWKLAKDDSLGQIVFHSGGIRGGRSFFIRNIDKDQCVIMLTNNELTDHHTFTTPMRILNR